MWFTLHQLIQPVSQLVIHLVSQSVVVISGDDNNRNWKVTSFKSSTLCSVSVTSSSVDTAAAITDFYIW